MPLAFNRMSELDLAGRRVLMREDLNVPVEDGEVRSDARLRAALPSHSGGAGRRRPPCCSAPTWAGLRKVLAPRRSLPFPWRRWRPVWRPCLADPCPCCPPSGRGGPASGLGIRGTPGKYSLGSGRKGR